MGDDFDLFPKRENLDPFSFGRKEKAEKPAETGGEEEVFGGQKPAAPTAEQPSGLPPLGGEPGVDVPTEKPAPPADMKAPEPFEPAPAPLPVTPPPEPAVDAAVPFGADDVLPEGFTDTAGTPAVPKNRTRRAPSPFILLLGALTLVAGVLYGVYTLFLKKEPPPPAPLPAVAVKVQPQTPPPASPGPGSEEEPGPASAAPAVEGPVTGQPTAAEPSAGEESATEPAAGESAVGEPSDKASETPPPEPVGEAPAARAPEPASAPPPATDVASATHAAGNFSVQVGALILESSVRELTGKLESLGYEPLLKEGSTTAMMNMLSVGPFQTVEEARAALSRIRRAGIDANLRRRTGGGALINAGSYLLESNAKSITRKVRSLGYPVQMTRRETKLGMTMVRVGRYETIEEASAFREELKARGLDAIVVKLQ